ncbi:uncharacterized protein BXZ73DRAFT_87916 [Epithele typhae]|uniref:uncharacterized protein n=1 Tax=Epithele typhae TaxID=378194 RepID=UPI0020074C78|nr:uncharacterized protein BXZ73DRAFT_87916 [Epithele typhae]KAH9942276.1 hypothetical protein BXZ73DRAFT_87916 [Epithele typhae]
MPASRLFVHVNSAHGPGTTSLAFSLDGLRVYTGGADSLVRLWDAEKGEDQEPPSAAEAADEISTLAPATGCWLSGSKDGDVRRYKNLAPGSESTPIFTGLVASAKGVAIRCVAVDPKGQRVAVTSDEPNIKLVDLDDITKVVILEGHTKAVRRATWHPSGALLTTTGADGKIIVWDVSGNDAKEEKVIEGLAPSVSDTESEEFGHDCSAVWHTSGQYFFTATRTHEIATVLRSNWSKSSTLSDDACTGAITALTLSKNGVYLAAASKSGIFIWATQTKQMLIRYQGSLTSPINQMLFSPTKNLLVWVDSSGDLTRWRDPIPSSRPDPVKLSAGTTTMGIVVKRRGTPTLFDDDADVAAAGSANEKHVEFDDDLGIDLDNDDWVLDDTDGGLNDDDGEARRLASEGGVREMVSVTKAQTAFQTGSTPMDNKKRYLAYNMVGVIEVTDQDTHHIVNVEFHDRSARKSYHFTDHFRYDIASLGERGALYACQPETGHPAHVIYKPYGSWASQSEWTYELPKGVRVLGVAAGGTPPSKSLRDRNDVDIGGQGNVVISTSDGELIFLSGSGIERTCLSIPGDFVTMVAGSEWVFVVTRDGSTTMDGSQNLMSRLIKFDDFCILQQGILPIPKRHTLKWVGVTEEGAPAIYDSAGILNTMPRFRIPLSATWMRVLDTNRLERREGKDESYWPVGVVGENFMCLILKGRQVHPSFPRPLIQDLPIRLPFKRTEPKEAPLEEQFARESMLLDIIRDGLGEELTSDSLTSRELALDKVLIQLIQHACKTDRLARALDLTRMLHLLPSFDSAIKIAGFYHLIGLQEKMEILKEDRQDDDRLEGLRERRRQLAGDFAPVPALRLPGAGASGQGSSKPKPFQDFRPPPALHRPGLERARAAEVPSQMSEDSTVFGPSFADNTQTQDSDWSSPDGKRKRAADDEGAATEVDAGAKRRAFAPESASTTLKPAARSNPFARKPGADNGRNPFSRSADANKSLHKSESFFTKVDAAEADKGKRSAPAKGKGKEKKEIGRQTTLFGLPPGQTVEKKAAGRKKKAGTPAEDSQESELKTQATDEPQTDVAMEDSQADTLSGGDTQLEEPTRLVNGQAENDEVIEWPDSPEPNGKQLEVEAD